MSSFYCLFYRNRARCLRWQVLLVSLQKSSPPSVMKHFKPLKRLLECTKMWAVRIIALVSGHLWLLAQYIRSSLEPKLSVLRLHQICHFVVWLQDHDIYTFTEKLKEIFRHPSSLHLLKGRCYLCQFGTTAAVSSFSYSPPITFTNY